MAGILAVNHQTSITHSRAGGSGERRFGFGRVSKMEIAVRLWYDVYMTFGEKTIIAEIMGRHKVAVGYVFGSAVRGTRGPHSDIDVAVLFDDALAQKEQGKEKMALAHEIAEACRTESADVINLATASDPLVKYTAVFSGTLVYEKDAAVRRMVEQNIVREYENTRELRRIAQSVMYQQLKDGSFGRALHLA